MRTFGPGLFNNGVSLFLFTATFALDQLPAIDPIVTEFVIDAVLDPPDPDDVDVELPHCVI